MRSFHSIVPQIILLIYEYIAFFYNNIALLKYFINYRCEGINLQKKSAKDRLERKISLTGSYT
jgi:hypothetical protein